MIEIIDIYVPAKVSLKEWFKNLRVLLYVIMQEKMFNKGVRYVSYQLPVASCGSSFVPRASLGD